MLVITLSAFVSSLLLTLGYAPFNESWLGWVGLVPLAWALAQRGIRFKDALLGGYLFGLSFFACTLFWLNEVSTLGWAVLSVYLALYPCAGLLVWWKLNQLHRSNLSLNNLVLSFVGATFWTLTEWARGTWLTGFSWNTLGVTQYQNIAVLQMAELTGVLGISWLLAFCNLTLAGLIITWKHLPAQRVSYRADAMTLMILLAGILGWGIQRYSQPEAPEVSLKILAIQPDIAQNPWESVPPWEATHQLEKLTRTALSEHSDVNLILWPETPIAESALSKHSYLGDSAEHFSKIKPIILGSVEVHFEQVYNSAVLLNPLENQQSWYAKRHLVMMGEYVPLAQIFPFLKSLVPIGTDFSSGVTSAIFEVNGMRMAPIICFEDTVSSVVRDSVKQSPHLLLNLTNDAWFKRSPAAEQHWRNALFRTVEFRLPLIRVTNNGVTGWIDERGVPQAVLKNPTVHDAGFLVFDVATPKPQRTFFARYGYAWLALWGVGCIAWMAMCRNN